MSIYNIPAELFSNGKYNANKVPAEFNLAVIKKEVLAAARRGSIIRILDVFLEHQPYLKLADAVLYSDIHIDEGRVIVTGAGEPFSTLKPGVSYPFEGTIAENIINYNLDYLIVDNTLESIKPIDWALFIPNGVKSYFAVPFYEDKILKTVLIFCSIKTDSFNPEIISSFKPLFPLFIEGLSVIKNKM
jgi:hypothetical protein